MTNPESTPKASLTLVKPTNEIKRLHDFTTLEKLIIHEIWPTISATPKDGKERVFRGDLVYQEEQFGIVCGYILSSDFLCLTELEISHKGKIINAPPVIPYKEFWLDENGNLMQ